MQISKSALALAVTAILSSQASADFKPQSTADALDEKPVFSEAPPHFRFPVHAHATSDAVLYDQSGIAEGIAPAQDYQSGFDAYDSEAADDFVVTDAAGWTVSAFNFQIGFALSSAPANISFDVDVYEDANGVPGAAACGYAALTGTLDASQTALSVALPTPCALVQGRYWVALSANLDFPPKMYWMAGAGAAIDNIAEWREPGDGNGTGCTDWTAMSSCTTTNNVTVGSGDLNLLFQVVGSVGISAGCAPGGLCLEATVGTDLTPGACASADAIDVSVGDQLNFCYTITNNTGIELDYHTLSDNVNGTIFTLLNQPVPDGGTFQFNRIATAGTTQTITSAWIGQDVPPGYVPEVTTGGGCADRIFADGFDNTAVPCAGGGGFIDITQTGTPLGLGDDDTTDVTMPFSFNFYGTTSNVLTVSNNGGALFNTPGSFLGFINTSLPNAALAGPAMLAMWDDFDSEQGDVYTDTRGSTPDRQFIVEWFDRVHFSGPSNTDGATFELILNEDGTIQFEYSDVDYSGIGSGEPDDCSGGVCATIGLQNDATLFNQFSVFETSVTDNSGILWTPTSPQVFMGADTLTVNVGAPDIDVQPPTLVGTVPEGGSSSIPFSIDNLGDRDLNWSLDEAAPSIAHFSPPGTRFVMPMGDPTKSTTAARPKLAFPHPRKPGHSHGNRIVLATGVTAFTADVYVDELYTLDVTADNGVSLVGSAQGTAFGFRFLDGDFSAAYGIDKFGNQMNTFATVSATDGTITPIGTSDASADGNGFTGFAQDPTSGTLYASGTTCGSSSHLYTIDRNTGAATLVGAMPDEPCAIWIAISPEGLMYSVDVVNDALYAVDKTSGATSLKGSVGFNTNFAQDADFDQSTGTLYWAAVNADQLTDEIRTVDLDTGDTTLVYSLGFTQIVGLATETVGGPCAQPQDLPWLSLGPTSGTTPPGGGSGITASIDGSGSVDGDTLSGTVCVNSNDPDEHRVEVPIDVTVGPAPPPPNPTVTKAFVPTTVDAATPSTLTITLANPSAAPADLTAPLTDTFPAGLVVAPTPNASTTCGGAVTAVAGSGSVTLDSAGSAIGPASSCTIDVDVEAAPGSYDNNIPVGALQTSAGSNLVAADAALQVIPIAPTIGKAFNPASVVANTPSTLTITLDNANATPAALTAPLTDTFPSGLVVATTPNAATTCGGAVTATAGTDFVTLDAVAAEIPAAGSCTITVDVESAVPNLYQNSIPSGDLQTDAGNNPLAAVAPLVVTP